MADEVNVWQPRSILKANADYTRVTQRFTALVDQTSFTLTEFAYELGTGSLAVYKNGLILRPSVDYAEQTDTTFVLISGCTAGDQILAVGYVSIAGTVAVATTDIYVANFQALRDFAGSETTLFAKGQVTTGDGYEAWFQKFVGAAPGFYVDDNKTIIVPTGGDGSAAWVMIMTRTGTEAQQAPSNADLGTAAYLAVGTTVGDVVQLEDVGGGTAGLPTTDARQLTGNPSLLYNSSGFTTVEVTPVADADIALTTAESKNLAVAMNTGSWTAGHNVTVPDEVRVYFVDASNCNYISTWKTAAGASVAIPANSLTIVYCDGVDVLDPFNAMKSYADAVGTAAVATANAYTDTQVAAIPAGWALIDTWIPTAVSSKDFTWDETLYSDIMIVGEGLIPATDGASFYGYLGYNNGGTFFSGTSTYIAQATYHTGLTLTAWAADGANSQMNIAVGIGTAANEGMSFVAQIHGASSTISAPYYEHHSNGRNTGGAGLTRKEIGYLYDNASTTPITNAIDSFRLALSVGNFEVAGVVYVYGLKR